VTTDARCSSTGRSRPLHLVQVAPSLVRGLVDMRGQLATPEGLAELGPEKAARRIARHARVVVIRQIPDHVGVVVSQLGRHAEVVVVDDRINLAPEGSQPASDDGPDTLDVLGRADAQPFEIDEDDVLLERGAWIRGAGALALPGSGVRQRGRSLGVPGPACG